MIDGIIIIPNFFTAAQCADLIQTLNQQHDRYVNRLASNRVEIPANEAEQPGLWHLRAFREYATTAMLTQFNSRALLEYCLLQSNFPGDGHVAHCDNCTDDGSPNHTPMRSHTCNLYLNNGDTDYEGGQLNFPELGISVSPKAGMLVAFPSGRQFKHEVLPIRSGVRHSILSWFTLDETHAMRTF